MFTSVLPSRSICAARVRTAFFEFLQMATALCSLSSNTNTEIL
jgi:hypothetical protein